MDASNLSNNWKQLQKSLKGSRHPPTKNGTAHKHPKEHDPHPHPPPKRKRPTGAHDEQPQRKFRAAVWRSDTEKKKKVAHEMDTQAARESAPTIPEPADQPAAASVSADRTAHLGKYVAIDTEMVGTHSPTAFSTPNKRAPFDHSILARVSLVSYDLTPLYDAYVLPPAGVRVTDYRTPFSGITPRHLDPSRARPFATVQADVAALLAGRVLVGHSVAGDLRVLGLSHARARLRDTAAHPRFRELYAAATSGLGAGIDGRPGGATSVGRREGGVGRAGVPLPARRLRSPGLKWLAANVLGWTIQGDEVQGHSSVEDARATMALFKGERAAFEAEARRVFGRAAAASALEDVIEIEADAGDDVKSDGPHDDENRMNAEVGEGENTDSSESDDGGVAKKAPQKKKKRKKGKKKGKYNRR